MNKFLSYESMETKGCDARFLRTIRLDKKVYTQKEMMIALFKCVNNTSFTLDYAAITDVDEQGRLYTDFCYYRKYLCIRGTPIVIHDSHVKRYLEIDNTFNCEAHKKDLTQDYPCNIYEDNSKTILKVPDNLIKDKMQLFYLLEKIIYQ